MNLNERLKTLKPYNLNCNVFSVYDYDGMSLQDLLCQFFTRINECIEKVNGTLDLVQWLVNQGLKEEVANKLNSWLIDGTLSQIINETIFNELNEKLNNKIEIVVAKTLPTNELRKENTYYFKVTKEYDITTSDVNNSCENIRVSPTLGFKIEED